MIMLKLDLNLCTKQNMEQDLKYCFKMFQKLPIALAQVEAWSNS